MSRTVVFGFVMLPFVVSVTSATADDNDNETATLKRARALVAQLGDEEFAVRENATDELVSLGLSALPALDEGRTHIDREIRYRCRRIDAVVRENDFQRRLEAFARNKEVGESYELPGWARFHELFGNGAESRELFVEIQKDESNAMKSFAEGPKAVASVLEVRTQQLMQETRVFKNQVSLGSVAAMLFMSADEEIALSPQASSSLYSLCYQASFQAAMKGGAHHQQIRKLLGAWVRRGADWSAYQAMSLAMQYDLDEGLVPAKRVLNQMGIQVHIRQYAILTIGKMGSDEDIPLLEALLEDKTQTSQRTINKIKYDTQVRDVALATLLHMTKQDFKKFGFERLQANSRMLFNTSTIGFKDEAERKVAFDKWKKFRESQKSEKE
jgi:hypothetical protein